MTHQLKKLAVVFCLAAIFSKNVYTPVLVNTNQKNPLRSTIALERTNN